MKRTPYKVNPNGYFNGGLLEHMRTVAFDPLKNGTTDTVERAERMRDDEGMLAAAELKRQRKLKARVV